MLALLMSAWHSRAQQCNLERATNVRMQISLTLLHVTDSHHVGLYNGCCQASAITNLGLDLF